MLGVFADGIEGFGKISRVEIKLKVREKYFQRYLKPRKFYGKFKKEKINKSAVQSHNKC